MAGYGDQTYLGGTELVTDGCPAGYIDASTECGTLYSPDLGASAMLYAYGPDFPIRFFDGPWYFGNGTLIQSGEPQYSGEHGGGLYRSTNNGTSWTWFTDNGYPDWYMWTVAWNQVEGPGSVLLGGGAGTGGDFNDSGVWKSTDGGASWRLVFPNTNHDYTRDVIAIALSPSGQAVMNLADGSLYWSTDAGETWTQVPGPQGGIVGGVIYLGNHLNGRQP